MEVSDGRTVRKQQEERGNIEKIKTWLRKKNRKSLPIIKQDCVSDLPLSRSTIYKHWDIAFSEVKNERD